MTLSIMLTIFIFVVIHEATNTKAFVHPKNSLQISSITTASRLTSELKKTSLPLLHQSKNDDGNSIYNGTVNNDDSDHDDFAEKLSEESRKRFEQITKEFLKVDDNTDSDFPSALPQNPFKSSVISGSNSGGPGLGKGKGSLYSDDELIDLLSIHNDISDELSDEYDNGNSESDGDDDNDNNSLPLQMPQANSPFALHDLVMKTLGNDEDISAGKNSSNNISSNLGYSDGKEKEETFQLDGELKQKIKQIRAIASDIDGTILSKRQTMHPRTRMAIQKAIYLSMESQSGSKSTIKPSSSKSIDYFFPATGKSRKGALDSLSKASIEIGSLIEHNCPGVYLQGLYCVDQQNNVIFEKKLNRNAIAAAESLVEETNVSIVAYDGDNLYTTEQSDIVIHLHEFYGEPLPVLLPPLQEVNHIGDNNAIVNTATDARKLSSHESSMHKLLIMDDDTEKLKNIVRPKLEKLAQTHDACVTQALPTMLELLPKGCSKAIGVSKLCQALSINVEEELMAIGDAENDTGMLQNACIGVAVGNACPTARDAADFVLDECNDDGGAGVAIEIFALGES